MESRCPHCGRSVEMVRHPNGEYLTVGLVKLVILPRDGWRREQGDRTVITDKGKIVRGPKVPMGTEGAVIARESHVTICDGLEGMEFGPRKRAVP